MLYLLVTLLTELDEAMDNTLYDIQTLLNESKFDDVISKTSELLKKQSNSPQIYNYRAKAYHNQGAFNEAASDYSKVANLTNDFDLKEYCQKQIYQICMESCTINGYEIYADILETKQISDMEKKYNYSSEIIKNFTENYNAENLDHYYQYLKVNCTHDLNMNTKLLQMAVHLNNYTALSLALQNFKKLYKNANNKTIYFDLLSYAKILSNVQVENYQNTVSEVMLVEQNNFIVDKQLEIIGLLENLIYIVQQITFVTAKTPVFVYQKDEIINKQNNVNEKKSLLLNFMDVLMEQLNKQFNIMFSNDNSTILNSSIYLNNINSIINSYNCYTLNYNFQNISQQCEQQGNENGAEKIQTLAQLYYNQILYQLQAKNLIQITQKRAQQKQDVSQELDELNTLIDRTVYILQNIQTNKTNKNVYNRMDENVDFLIDILDHYFLLKMDNAFTDYYQILNISKNSSQKEIKSQYYSLSQQYHPDSVSKRNLSEIETKQIQRDYQRIQEAYDLLSDIDRKFKYDQQRDPLDEYKIRREKHEERKSNVRSKIQGWR